MAPQKVLVSYKKKKKKKKKITHYETDVSSEQLTTDMSDICQYCKCCAIYEKHESFDTASRFVPWRSKKSLHYPGMDEIAGINEPTDLHIILIR